MQVFQALFFLAVVAGLAYLTARFLGARAMRLGEGRAIRLVDVVNLGPRRQACILSVGDRAFLVGVTDQCVSKIAEFAGSEIAGLRAPDYPEDRRGSGAQEFVARLSALLRRPGEGEGR